MNRKSWRTFLLGSLTGLTVGALLATAVHRIDPPGPFDDLEKGPLIILSGKDDSGQRDELIDLWNDMHPENPAVIQPLDRSADDQYAAMVAPAADVDIVNLDVTWTARFAEPVNGQGPLLRPIDESRLLERPDDVFLRRPLETCRHNGKLWALPFNTDAGLLYYRKDRGLKPPFSWSEMQTETARILAGRPPGIKAGYTSQLAQYEGLTVNMLETVWALDGDIRIDEAGNVTLDLAVWNRAVQLLTPRPDPKAFVLPESVRYAEDNSRVAFSGGETLFMRNWPVAHRRMWTDAAAKPFAFDVTPLPGDSVLGGQNLAILANTEQPRAAQALIEFLTAAGSQRRLFKKGGFAATRSVVYDDPAIADKYDYLPELRAAVEEARIRPVSPKYVEFSKRLTAIVHPVLTGQEKALPADLAERLSEALKGR